MRMRTRMVHPEFYKNVELYEAEIASGFPLRLAYEGLWGMADREGRFEWKPRVLKLDILPFDTVDFGDVLDALAVTGFVRKYEVDGKMYGFIPTMLSWQPIHKDERKSRLPAPPAKPPEIPVDSPKSQVVKDRRVTPRRPRKTDPNPANPQESLGISRNLGESSPASTSTSTSTSASTSTSTSPEALAPVGAGNGALKLSRGPPTWLTPFAEPWEKRAGAFPYGAGAKAIAKVVNLLTPTVPDAQAETLRRWLIYLDRTDAEYWSVHRFANTYHLWDAAVANGAISDEPAIEYL